MELIASEFNSFWHWHSRDDEMIESFVYSIRTGLIDKLLLDEGPDDEEFGRRVAQALTSNAHVTEIDLIRKYHNGGVRGAMKWFTPSTAGETPTPTLAPFTNLAKMSLSGIYFDISVEDWDLIFQLLLTSTSLQELDLSMNLQDDRGMSSFAQYLGAATRASLRTFKLYTTDSLSGGVFVSLCDSVAGSQLRKLSLIGRDGGRAHLESDAESLARAIAESPLEEVMIPCTMLSRLGSALLHTQPIRNLDFAISEIDYMDGVFTRMVINREWKPNS